MQSRVKKFKGAVAVCLLALTLLLAARLSGLPGGQVSPSRLQQQTRNPVTLKTLRQDVNANAYFGDLHVHTTYSMDAFQFGTLATPDDAYRYAQGEAIKHPAGFDVQLDRPLDFYAVTDHGLSSGWFVLGPIPQQPYLSTQQWRQSII